MTDVPVEKPSVGVSILAATLVLGGLPLGLTFLVMATRGGEDLAQLWNEGGWGMYPMLLLTMVTTLVSAVGVYLAPRGVPAVLGAALVATVLVMGVSAFAYRKAGTGSFEAIAFANPLDQPVIMRSALGEMASLVVLAAALIAGLLVMQGLGLLVASFATRQASTKRGLLVVGLALVCLGGWQFFTALSAGAERDFYAAMSHASSMDRLTLVVDGLERLSSSRKMGLGPLLAALLVAFGGAASLRGDRRAAAGVLFGVLVPLVGLGGLRALARPSAQVLDLATSPVKTPALMQLDATPIDERDFQLLILGTGLSTAEGEPTTVEERMMRISLEHVGLGLEPSATQEAVVALLAKLKGKGMTTVTLVGQKRTEPPPGVPPEWDFLFTERRGLTFGVASASECERCAFAQVTEQGLVVDEETWPLVTSSFALVPDETRKVSVKLEGLSLEQVLWVGHTVASKSQRAVLVLPDAVAP